MSILNWFYTPGERAIMAKFDALKDDLLAKQAEILALLETLDTQVEAMFEVIKSGEVPDEAAAQLTKGLEDIKAAAAKVATDDEPTT